MKFTIIFLSLITLSKFSQSLAQNRFFDIRTKVEVIYIPEPNMFPASWYEGEIKGEAWKLSEIEKERTKKIILKALSKYPTEVIKQNLSKIYLLKRLRFYQLDYGGTYSGKTIFLTNNGESEGYTEEYIEQTFHHEFSSILYFNYISFFDKKNWQKANKPNFTYGNGGIEALRTGHSSTTFDDELHKIGFLTEYSTSELEEDINVFAQNLFRASKNFWRITQQYPRIGQKLNVLLKFYQQIHPKFTKSFFQKISKE